MEGGNFRNDTVFSKKIFAGKRTYYFDVRKTRKGDFFLTISEVKADSERNDNYLKQKLFLYKEDFNKFTNALDEALNHIKTELMPDYDFSRYEQRRHEFTVVEENSNEESYSDLPEQM